MSAPALRRSAAETADAPGRLAVRRLMKSFGETTAVRDVSFDVPVGSFLSLLGASGCGKTTALRMIAGLEKPDTGEITIDGRTVFSRERRVDVPPQRRSLGMVFQSFALWPHMTVFGNVAYPLRRARVPKADIGRSVQRTLERMRVAHLRDRYPSELSGGQQQRVALARATVSDRNTVVLFDEPLSNLDARLRQELREELRGLQQSLGFTAIYVTHDRDEAISMSDMIAVLHEGNLERIAAPLQLVDDPGTVPVARLLGLHTVLDGQVTAGGAVTTALGTLPVNGDLPAAGSRVTVAVANRDLTVGRQREDGPSFEATVEQIGLTGSAWELRLTTTAGRVSCLVPRGETFERGDKVSVRVTGRAAVLRGAGAH